jgi:hypothetical protein
MRCGHAIHSACYNSYIRTNFTWYDQPAQRQI